MSTNVSKVLIVHTSFTAVIKNERIGKGIGGIWKNTNNSYIYVL